MEIIKNQIEMLINRLEDMRRAANMELTQCPDGRLNFRGDRGKHFLISTDKEGCQHRSAIRDNETLKRYARREYLNMMLPEIDVMIKSLKLMRRNFDEYSTEAVVDKMRKAYRLLPLEYFATPCLDVYSMNEYVEKAREWAKGPYTMSTYKPEYKTEITSRGLKVRSKSEVLLAEWYYAKGIPFRYEETINIGGIWVIPDFSILMPDDSVYFHEHAGMMDNLGYRENHHRKMQRYEDAGIYPWENLLVTYDRDGHINMKEIGSIIEGTIISKIKDMQVPVL